MELVCRQSYQCTVQKCCIWRLLQNRTLNNQDFSVKHVQEIWIRLPFPFYFLTFFFFFNSVIFNTFSNFVLFCVLLISGLTHKEASHEFIKNVSLSFTKSLLWLIRMALSQLLQLKVSWNWFKTWNITSNYACCSVFFPFKKKSLWFIRFNELIEFEKCKWFSHMSFPQPLGHSTEFPFIWTNTMLCRSIHSVGKVMSRSLQRGLVVSILWLIELQSHQAVHPP